MEVHELEPSVPSHLYSTFDTHQWTDMSGPCLKGTATREPNQREFQKATEEEEEAEEEEATRGLLIFLQGTQTLQYPSLPLFLFLLQAFVFDIAFRQSNFAIYWRM